MNKTKQLRGRNKYGRCVPTGAAHVAMAFVGKMAADLPTLPILPPSAANAASRSPFCSPNTPPLVYAPFKPRTQHTSRILPLLLLFCITSCGGGGLYTNADITPQTSISESADAGTAAVTKDAFLFASPYPARILIPDIEGMRGTAFVVSTVNPSGVIALDLDHTPIVLSPKFKGLNSPKGSGLPNNLVIQSATRAFMLTSSAVVDFNPTTGEVNGTVMFPTSVTLSVPAPLSRPFDYDNDGKDNTTISEIPIQSPGGIAISGNTLWISTANYLRYPAPAAAAPGVILRYTIGAAELSPLAPLLTTGFNPTGIAVVGNEVFITNSGVLDIIGGEAVPRTASSVDIFDSTTGVPIANVSAGLASLSFLPPAIDTEGRFAYFGSSALSEVSQLDILQRLFPRGATDPILLAPAGAPDYITGIALSPDGRRAYVGSFDSSAIFLLNLTASPIAAMPTHYTVGFPKGVTAENPTGVNTGVGDIAVRPGTPGIDFQGADIFVLTGNPGTLVTIATQGKPSPGADIRTLSIAPSFVPLEVGKLATVTGDVTFGDGRQIINLHSQFAHPITGQYLMLQWSSDNPAIATVSPDGLVTGISAGITTLRAHIGKTTASVPVAVHLGPASLPSASGNASAQPPPQSQQPPEDQPPPLDGGKLIVIACKDIGESPFIQGVVSTQVGAGGGAGKDKLPDIIIGPPHGAGTMQGSSTSVYSLGAYGQIIVAFANCIIADGPGVDFTVFENAFYAGGNPEAPFSEPAVVGVSMDGINFTDFPCDLSQSPKFSGCAGTHPVLSSPENGIDPLDPEVSGGDPFDLGTVGMKQARFVRIIDQGLSPMYGANGTNGFDLDAIAVIHGAKPKP